MINGACAGIGTPNPFGGKGGRVGSLNELGFVVDVIAVCPVTEIDAFKAVGACGGNGRFPIKNLFRIPPIRKITVRLIPSL